jgi:4-amino-4-deoxychorismate lyase
MQNQFLINGKPEDSISPLDRGFSYGDGVFRTLPIRGGIPVAWERHYRKLSEDCNALGIVCPAEEVLLADMERLSGEKRDSVIKIIVTRGEGERGYTLPALAKPNRIVLCSPLPSYPVRNNAFGVRLHLCRLQLSSQPLLAGIKHLNRLENVLARTEWHDPEIAEGLLRDQSGNVIECTMSNIFIRQGNRLVTPDLGKCGVAGVTREIIMETAGQQGYEVAAETFSLDDLLQAEEVVICNSLIGVWQVRQLDEHQWPAGTLAEKLRLLLE